MRCPKCGHTVKVGSSIRAVITDIQDHITVMVAHVDIVKAASPANPINRRFEIEQVIGSAKAIIHLIKALEIISEVFDPGAGANPLLQASAEDAENDDRLGDGRD